MPGDPEHGELFKKWGTTLADMASQKLGMREGQRDAAHRRRGDERRRHQGVRDARGQGGRRKTRSRSCSSGTARSPQRRQVQPAGPGHGAAGFRAAARALKSKRIIFVNTASASGPFVEALSGPGRVIVTATRTGDEKYATLFGGPFVDAFTTEAADADRDGKVSILEAFDYARKAVAASYVREGLLPTEHALLDDNGDKQGSMEPGRQAKDGQSAAVLSLGSMHQQALPADEKLRALYLERQQIERRIESLKLLKSGMDPEKYAAELETARHRARDEDAADSRRGREGQMKSGPHRAWRLRLTTVACGRRRRARSAPDQFRRRPRPVQAGPAGRVSGQHALRRPLRVRPPALHPVGYGGAARRPPVVA